MDTFKVGRQHHRHRNSSSIVINKDGCDGDKELPDYVQTVVVKDSKGLEKVLLLPKALDLDRPKRSRTAFSKWQLDALESAFTANPYLVGEHRTSLARRLGLSETQIKVWYQNRRTKQRKEGNPSAVQDSSTSPTSSSEVLYHVITPSPPELQWMPPSYRVDVAEPINMTRRAAETDACHHAGNVMAFHRYQQNAAAASAYQRFVQSYSNVNHDNMHVLSSSVNASMATQPFGLIGTRTNVSNNHPSVNNTSNEHQHRLFL